MTGTDLIVLAPWIVFAAGLAVVGVLLVLRSRRASGPSRRSGRSRPSGSRRRRNRQETRCPENHEPARPR